MMSKTVTGVAFAAGCVLAFAAMPAAHAQSYPPPLPQPYAAPPPPAPPAQAYMQYSPQPEPAGMPTQMVTNGPQASPGDFGDWSARRNNIESAHYDRLLETRMGFRQARMAKECGPIGDPQLHDQCMASFQQFEPVMSGSSTPPWRHRTSRGAGY